MRFSHVGAMVALVACSLAGAAETAGSCSQPLETALRSRATLEIESRPAGIEIVGTDKDAIRVYCTSDQPAVAHRIALRFSGTSDVGKLTITGGALKNGNLHIRIEVPRKTDLEIHMPAGQVSVEKVTGDKDISLYAGQITIASPDDAAYQSVLASVGVGEVKASAFGIDKGGFFRCFRRDSSEGEYRLRATLLTGQIDLE